MKVDEKENWTLPWIVASIMILLVSGFLLVIANTCINRPTFTGKLIFYSNEDYTSFKLAVADPNVSIESLAVLSSDVPIIVDFCVSAPPNFSYGSSDINEFRHIAEVSKLLIVFSGVSLIVFLAEQSRRKK